MTRNGLLRLQWPVLFLGRPTAFVASMRRRCNDGWRGSKEGGGGLDLTPLRGLQISPAQLLLSLKLKTLGCERVFPLRSKRFAVSALEFFDAIWLRRPCLDRFAVFTKASRNDLNDTQSGVC